MFPPDLSHLKEGSIFGISIMGAIRNIGIVDKMSNGIVKAHAVIGQFDIAFALDGADSSIPSERLNQIARQPELLNGRWAKGMAIAYTGALDHALENKIRELDLSLKGVSPMASKVILKKCDTELNEALADMNFEANNLEPELPFRALSP